MEMLADHGNGHYAYLDSLQEARRLLVREADATLETVAKDVKFQVEFNPAAVAAWKLHRLREARGWPPATSTTIGRTAARLGAGHAVTVLYRSRCPSASRTAMRPGARPAGQSAEVSTGADAAGAIARRAMTSSPAPAASGSPSRRASRRRKVRRATSSRRPLVPVGACSALPMAAAVAEFGLLLRDGPFPVARWDSLLRHIDALQVPSNLPSDRDSFRELAATAAGLARLR